MLGVFFLFFNRLGFAEIVKWGFWGVGFRRVLGYILFGEVLWRIDGFFLGFILIWGEVFVISN